jgi:hypothetical protein
VASGVGGEPVVGTRPLREGTGQRRGGDTCRPGYHSVAIKAIGDVWTVAGHLLTTIDGSAGSRLELGEIDGVNAQRIAVHRV